MPRKTPDDSRVVSVRLPSLLLQRLDRLLEWHTTHRRRPTTRTAALRAALGDWLDQQEQLAGLLDAQVLRQQFHAASISLRPSATGVPISRLRQVLQ
jgi:metal-responsive CopG/Arc/MetJ family transcriptional regulator